jgi:hypothetical protein
VGEESAPFFGIRASAIQGKMKRALYEQFEHDESPFVGKIQTGLLSKAVSERMLFPTEER